MLLRLFGPTEQSFKGDNENIYFYSNMGKWDAKEQQVRDMTEAEWQAYKNKLKNKIKTYDKEKANKVADKLKKMKAARKSKKQSRKTKEEKQKNQEEQDKRQAEYDKEAKKQKRN